MVRSKSDGLKRQMPSKSHSCSELQEGNRRLLEVKKEAEREEGLQQRIKDGLCVCFFHNIVWSYK